PFAPDKQHLHHRLLEFGHSHRRAVLIMWLWAGLVGSSIVLLSLYSGRTMWIVFAVMVVVTVALTFALPRLHNPVPDIVGAVSPDAAGARVPPLRDFVIVFTSGRNCRPSLRKSSTDQAADMTTATKQAP